MYIVAFNGPPESGKDTMADMLADHMDKQGVSLPVRMESLSLPLRKIAYSTVGYPTFPESMLAGEWYASFKRAHFRLLGVTGRQLMIDVSEKFLKPTYGIEVMAKLLLERNEGFHGILLIRDSGFQIEVDPLIQAVGHTNLYVANVERKGKTFANDSREWVHHPMFRQGYQGAYRNNGSLDDLRTEAGRLYGRLVNNLGWKL